MGGKGLTDVNSFFEFYSGRQGLCFDVIWVVGTEPSRVQLLQSGGL